MIDPSPWQHEHVFDRGNPAGERNTRRVVALTAGMMAGEIVAGSLFGSMALLADGWHMGTHVGALGVTAIAYALARRHASDGRFAFGTWKIEVLGGFASAIVLAVVALYMAAMSVQRFFQPLDIRYDQALPVAVAGLLVNLASALMLRDRGHHEHRHHDGGSTNHGHDHGGHGDLNLRAAYVHVLADATTSVLAILALLGGRFLGWSWLDPGMGIVGSAVIGIWAIRLLRNTGRVLLDREMDHDLVREIRETLESDEDTRIADLHVWRVGRDRYACIVSVVARNPLTPDEYRVRLSAHEEIAHVTVEVVRR